MFCNVGTEVCFHDTIKLIAKEGVQVAYQWWQGAVVYRMYVRSFQDSDGDGVGDLMGLISRLGYVEALGVDAIWLTPVFGSPNFDFGYDVSDFYSIHEDFGSLDEFDLLIREAHQRGIKVIIDLVLNHTSIEHPWFIQSRSSKEGEYADYYIWSDEIPNNWIAAFGGRAWSLDNLRGQYYMHSFFRQQPDLNWRNPKVVDELHGVIRFWLERGIDGLCLDVINSIAKDETLRNNPKIIGARPRAYDMQRHIFDRNRPESHTRVRQIRKLVDGYDGRVLFGEVMAELPGEPELAASYLGTGSDQLHLSLDSSLANARFSAQGWKRVAKRWYEATGRLRDPSWVLNSHDLMRLATKVKGDVDKLKLAALFLMTQRGTIFIYYGEELGLPDSAVWPKEMKDPLGKKFWPFMKSRDVSRGPMVWSTGPGNGFTTGESWLPFTKSANFYSVENQGLEKDSMLNFYRTVIALRSDDIVLKMGHCRFMECKNSNILIYTRSLGEGRRMVILNMSGTSQACSLKDVLEEEDAVALRLFSTHLDGRARETGESSVELEPWQGSVYDLVDQRRKSRSS